MISDEFCPHNTHQRSFEVLIWQHSFLELNSPGRTVLVEVTKTVKKAGLLRPEQRARFLANIRNETGRTQNIVDRLPALTKLENLNILKNAENISFGTLVKALLESKPPLCIQKRLTVAVSIPDDLIVSSVISSCNLLKLLIF